MCSSVLQYVAVCCSVLQGVAQASNEARNARDEKVAVCSVYNSALQCNVVCCSAL